VERADFFKICGAGRDAESGRCRQDIARFLCCCSLISAAPFSAALKKALILLGFSMFSYGNALEARTFLLRNMKIVWQGFYLSHTTT